MLAARVGLAVAIAALALPAFAVADATIERSVRGDDWSLPPGDPAPNSGFFSERASVDAEKRIDLRGFDLSWRQIQPDGPGTFETGATGEAEGMELPSFADQNADQRLFWMRLFASATVWAPSWLPKVCAYKPVGPDYDKQMHIPVWDPCVWDKLRAAWRALMIGQGLRSDPRLRFVYVPGAFTWVEFDYDMVNLGMKRGLTFQAYRDWHAQMLRDLVAIMNGENDDPSDDFAYKLVYTGEDYPYSDFGDQVAFFARDAVDAGMGIRNGITELFNHHLSEIPAYGTTIGPDGHLVTDDDWKLFDGKRVAATENECFDDCGLHSKDPWYVMKMSNLKALQMRLNWIYVAADKFFRRPRAFLDWVRRELGQRPETAPDAWVALRQAQEVYWADRGDKKWKGFPWIRNYERWIVQRDVAPDGVARRGTLRHVNDPTRDNGTAFESLRTNVRRGQRNLYLDVDQRFMSGATSAPIELKVSYRDYARRAWRVDYRAVGAVTRSSPLVRGRRGGTGGIRTVTLRIDDPSFDNGLPGGADIALHAVRGDLEASFVRVVR